MKKLLAVLLTLSLMVVGVSALAETVSLKVWGAQDDQETTPEAAEAFKAANPDKTYDITFGVVGEPTPKPSTWRTRRRAADVFAFAGDQLYELLQADVLYEVTINKDAVIAANTPGSIEAATVKNILYAYPMTADNGYSLL